MIMIWFIKTKNPFKIRITITSDLEDELAILKLHKAPVIEGLSKEYIEHKVVRETVKNLFANEKFTNRLVGLTNIKVNGENTVKELIESLNKLTNAEIFGENEDLNKYKFQYYTNLNKNTELIVENDIVIDLNVYDQDTEMPFFSTKFDIKIPVETDQEKYDRISEKIRAYLSNKELDLSKYEELNADGKIQWKETLSKILNPDKNYGYFNFEALGEKFKLQYPEIIDFEIALDVEKADEIDNNYFTYNSEQHYVPVKLKIFKKGTSDANFKEKNVDLKIKVGGLTSQQLYQKQEEARIKFEKVLENRLPERTTFEKFMAVNRDFDAWKWESALDFLNNNLNIFWDFDKSKIPLEEITNYLDMKISKEGIENQNDIIKEKDETFLTSVWANIKFNVTVSPKGKKSWVNDGKYIYNFDYYTDNKWHLYDFSDIFYDTLADNEALFTTTNLKPGNDTEGHPIKLKTLLNEIDEKIRKLISQTPTLNEIFKFLTTWVGASNDKGSIDQETSLEKTDYIIKVALGYKTGSGHVWKEPFTVKIT